MKKFDPRKRDQQQQSKALRETAKSGESALSGKTLTVLNRLQPPATGRIEAIQPRVSQLPKKTRYVETISDDEFRRRANRSLMSKHKWPRAQDRVVDGKIAHEILPDPDPLDQANREMLPPNDRYPQEDEDG